MGHPGRSKSCGPGQVRLEESLDHRADRSAPVRRNLRGESARQSGPDPPGDRHTADPIPTSPPTAQAGQAPLRQGLRLLPPAAVVARVRPHLRIARKGIETSQRLGRHRWMIERTRPGLARRLPTSPPTPRAQSRTLPRLHPHLLPQARQSSAPLVRWRASNGAPTLVTVAEPKHQIRALYTASTITVYQAYGREIGLPAARDGRADHRHTWLIRSSADRLRDLGLPHTQGRLRGSSTPAELPVVDLRPRRPVDQAVQAYRAAPGRDDTGEDRRRGAASSVTGSGARRDLREGRRVNDSVEPFTRLRLAGLGFSAFDAVADSEDR